MGRLADVYNESDCEEDSLGVRDEPPGTKEGAEEPTQALLTTGSFAAYVHFHFPVLSFSQRKQRIPQVEISLLLPLHG